MFDNFKKLHTIGFRAAKRNNDIIYVGFVLVCILAVLGLVLQLKRGFDGMDPTWTFSTGIEVVGIFICAIIYYSCMNGDNHSDDKLIVFISMLVPTAFALFLDLVAWLVQSNPDTILINTLSNAILHIFYYVIGYLFWVYVYKVLKYHSKLIEATNIVFSFLIMFAVLVCVADIFFPIYFTVDAAGEYRRAPLYILRPFVYLVLFPAYMELCIRSKQPIKTKVIVSTVLFLPLLAEILTFMKFGISTKPGAIMLAIIINFGVVISDRGKAYVKTKNELDIASKIQVALLPSIFPPYPERKDFEIYALSEPAREVGGDFYDFFMIDDRHFAILIADVSDKGMGAALFMTISKILIKTRAQMGGTPSEIVSFVDKRITEENTTGMFVTLWFAIVDLETGHVDACNAGHDYPAIMKSGEDFVIEKTPHGPPVGFIPGMEFPMISFDMQAGDRIFLYTDGIIDAKKSNSSRFGTEGMLKVLNSNKEASNEDLVVAVRNAANEFAGNEPQFDDMTMLSFTYLGR